MAVTWRELFDYANRRRKKGRPDPTFREAARRFRATLDEIEVAAEDAKGSGLPCDITVGFRCGAGIAEFKRGEWSLETWDDEDTP